MEQIIKKWQTVLPSRLGTVLSSHKAEELVRSQGLRGHASPHSRSTLTGVGSLPSAVLRPLPCAWIQLWFSHHPSYSLVHAPLFHSPCSTIVPLEAHLLNNTKESV